MGLFFILLFLALPCFFLNGLLFSLRIFGGLFLLRSIFFPRKKAERCFNRTGVNQFYLGTKEKGTKSLLLLKAPLLDLS